MSLCKFSPYRDRKSAVFSALIVTENGTLLSVSSINGLRATWHAVNFVDSRSSHKVPIKPELNCAVQKSKSAYNQEHLLQQAAASQVSKDHEDHTSAEEGTRT